MNDVEFILSMQEKRSKNERMLRMKLEELEIRINENVVPGAKYNKGSSGKHNQPSNYMERMMIDYDTTLAKWNKRKESNKKYESEFEEFLKPLDDLKASEMEKPETKYKRYSINDMYYTYFTDYAEVGRIQKLRKQTIIKHLDMGGVLLGEYYKGVRLQQKFPQLFKIA